MWKPNRSNREKTKLETLIANNGGAYRTTGRDSVFFQLYTGVEFLPAPPQAQRRGVVVTLILDAPPSGAARDKDVKKRFAHWEHSRRLQGSSLVALVVVPRPGEVRAHLGIVASYGRDLAESSRREQGRIQLKVSFFDEEVELAALRGDRMCSRRGRFAVLVDNSVMFDAVRPFLQKLQTVEPTEIPFPRYISVANSLERVQVQPPKYALAPAFKFRLQCLARKGETIADMDVRIPGAVERARDQLKRSSVLDPSQAEAVVDTLMREVSLIQGCAFYSPL